MSPSDETRTYRALESLHPPSTICTRTAKPPRHPLATASDYDIMHILLSHPTHTMSHTLITLIIQQPKHKYSHPYVYTLYPRAKRYTM